MRPELTRILFLLLLAPLGVMGGNFPGRSSARTDIVPSITGSDTACTGTITYQYSTEENMYDYLWSVSAGGQITSGEYSNTITVSWATPGAHTVSVIYDGATSAATLNVTVLDPVDIGISVSVSANPVCAGSTATFTATVANGGSSPDYQWRVNGVDVGTNSPVFSYVPDNGNLVTCQVISDLPCTNANPATSSPVIMTVSQTVPVSITIAASSNPTCTGSPVTFTAIPVNEGPGPVYQWKVNGVNAGSNSPIFTYTPANGEVVTCILTSNTACPSGNPAISNPILMTVSPSLLVGVSISASANPSCVGNQVSFTATPSNGGSSPGFEWLINNVPSGSGTVLTYSPQNGDHVVCKLTSSAGCATGNPATSNVITMTVEDFIPVSANISASANPVCSGTPVNFSATVVNGGSNPEFEWVVNSITIVNNNPTYTYVPDDDDYIICNVTSSDLCVSGNPAVSNGITMNVTPTLPPSVSIAASQNPACQGTPVQFTATTVNAGSDPDYQWFVNSTPMGENSAIFTHVPVDGEIVKCRLTSGDLCTFGQTVISNEIIMIVSPGLGVGITIEASINPTCTGSQVSFTSDITNGGSNPVYDWYANGVALNIHTPVLDYIPANNDVITCKVTSDLSCATGNPATSNAITMTVSAALPVGLTIAPSSNPSCQGQTVTFTASPLNEGTNPTYQWVVNGVNMGGNEPELSYNPTNGDSIVCFLTSNFPCATGNPATSNKIHMTVHPFLPVTIGITSSLNPSCLGSLVTYTATTTNAGSNPFYQWKVNGLNAGNNQSTYSYVPVSGDVVTCVLTPGIPCPVNSPVTSNSITQTALPIVTAGISITASGNPVCTGTQVTFTPTTTNGGGSPSLQWYINGIAAGTGPLLIYTPNNGEVISCRLTSSLQCVSGNPVMSNSITMVVSSSLPLSATITSSANPFCQGSNVTFSASAVNAGISPSYQWRVNGVNTGMNQNYTFAPAEGDFVTCSITSSLWCANPNPAQSNPILMHVNTNTPAGISVTVSSNPVCSGSVVTFTATPVNGGSTPHYQWKKNGTPVGTDSPVLSYTPANNDAITCTLTSNANCVSGSPVTSVPVVMSVVSAMPAAISVSASMNPFCAGDSVKFTAVPVNGGTSPSCQWKVNGVNQGSNSLFFKYPPANGDQVTCWLTSNSTCISGPNPVQSNTVTMNTAVSLPVSVSIVVSQNPVCQGTPVTFTATAVNGGENPVYQWKIDGVNTGTNNRTYVYSNPVNAKVITCVVTSSLGCASGNPATSNAIAMTVTPPDPVSVTIAATTNPVCLGTLEHFSATPVNGGSNPVYKWRVNGSIIPDSTGPTYSYVPVDGDMVTCELTSNATCISGNPAMSNVILISVSQELPVSVIISPSANPFCMGQNVTYTAIPENGGTVPIYEWFVNGLPAGTNNPIYTYAPQPGDNVKCRLTSNEACICNNPAWSNIVTMEESANLPVGCSITASLNPVCAGTNVIFNATVVNGGTNPHYQWKVNGISVGSNSNAHQYPPLNGDVVTCVVTSTLPCATNNPATSNQIIMTVNPLQPVSVVVVATQNPACIGSSICFTATATNGGSSPFYRWRVNGDNQGTNSPTYCFVPNNGDEVYCRVTSNALCASNNPANSNKIYMAMIPNGTVGITIAASANPVCQGSQVTFTATPVNGGTSPQYQWKVNGVFSGSNSPTFSYTPTNADVVTCDIVSNAMCVSPNTATSNAVTMIVSPMLPVSVSIVVSANPVCQGSPVTFNAIPVNGGASPSYQWKVNGVNAGSNSSLYSYTPVNGDIVSCVMTSNAACAQGSPATSNSVTIAVNSSMPVSVSITASSNPACQGQQVCYTATPVNGGTSPIYQWKVNNMNVGTNNPVFCYIPSSGDKVQCQLTSSYSCASGNPALSNAITVAFYPNLPVGVSIACSANPACQGVSVTYTASPTNGGASPTFQWKINGSPVGGNTATYSYAPANGDIVTCMLTSSIPCPLNNPVTSNSITMSVLIPVTAGVSVTASSNPVCTGTSVTYVATPSNGGSAPVYQWFVNGVPNGGPSQNLTYTPSNGDIITCQMTSSMTCLTVNPVMSAPIVMSVGTDFPVSISISASNNPCCAGQPVTFTATPVNGGVAPVYQWKVNGINVGTNSSSYSYVPNNGDQIQCMVTSDYSCASGNPALSSPVTMVVNPNLPASVSIASSFNPACIGTPITYTATPVNGGVAPSYQWKVNGINAGTNNSTYTFTPANNDVITCMMTSSLTCITGSPAFSNAIQMIVGTSFPLSITVSPSANPICTGTTVTFTAVPFYGGSSPVYQWRVNGIPVGTNSIYYTTMPSEGDQVTCTLTSDLTCATGNPAVSNVVTMAVLPVPVGISISCSPTGAVCAGTFVTFTATPQNGGPTPTYVWKVNGNTAGSNNPVFSYPPGNGDVVTCVMTSNATCATGNTATSNAIPMTVDPLMPVSVSVAAVPSGPVCSGTFVTFTATAVNGGSAPVYQWKVNGIATGSNNPVFSRVPVNGDIITCTVTSNEICPTGNPATSVPLVMTVNPNLPVSVAISANPPGEICVGSSVVYTAAAINGGTNPVYQWLVNGIPNGSNASVFTYTPVNGDLVSCRLTSNAVCPAGNPALSNTIPMTVKPILPVSVSITSSGNPVCEGTPVTFTASAVNGGGTPAFQWKINGVAAGGNNSIFTYTPLNGEIITCILTSSETCSSGNPATSNPVAMTVNQNLPVSVTITASIPPVICAGTLIHFSAVAVNGGTDPIYQWKVNGINAGTSAPDFSYAPQDGDAVTCTVTSNSVCASGNPAISNEIILTVHPVLPVGISISVDPQGDVCEGTLMNFHATVQNEGSFPDYFWKINGIDFGSNDPDFFYLPVDGDLITCILVSSINCPSNNPDTSNIIQMTVHSLMPVSVSVTSDPPGPVCDGIPVTYTATPFNGGAAPLFQWKVNGSDAGTNDPVFIRTPQNGDEITCEITSDALCATGNPAVSTPVVMTVYPNLPVSVTITANPPGPVCAGTLVSFSANAVNGGANPLYQWYVNDLPAGSPLPVFGYQPLQGDKVYCKVSSGIECPTGNPASSNLIQMTVNPVLPVAIFVAPSANPVCEGTEVTFTATAVNAGASPSYQWKVNGVNAGTNSGIFSYVPVHGDVITCVLTSSEICASGNPAVSDPVPMIVYPTLSVSVSVEANPPGTVCEGTLVTYTAVPINGGSAPAFQWKVNGTNAGTGQASFVYSPVTGDVITCVLTSNVICPLENPAVSNPVVMNVDPNLPVSVTISMDPAGGVCEGTPVTCTAMPVNGGSNPQFQWYLNGLPAGLNDPVLIITPVAGDIISCRLVSDIVCTSGNPSFSNTLYAVVFPSEPVSISVDVSSNPVCEGSPVTFTATAINGGTDPEYHWMINGTDAGVDSQDYTYIPGNGDQVYCKVSSNALCPSGNPATSNTLQMTVNPVLPVSISIVSDPAGPVCDGTAVTFTAAAINGGTSPVYQWRVDGSARGGNNSQYSYIPQNGETVSCTLLSNALCPSGNPAVSNNIPMTVNINLPVSVTLSASANPVCENNPVTFTAAAVNGGSNPHYQWKLNGGSAGTDDPVFLMTPESGDVVTCTLISDETCTTGNPATGSPIQMIVAPNPDVSFALCVDPVSTTDARPFRLKGGIPLGGIYSGSGVNPATGMFDPNAAGSGSHQIRYIYTNVTTCSDTAYLVLQVEDPALFTCGNNFTDPRDGKVYSTITAGSQCWFAVNLNYGQTISSSMTQRDNCIVEKYCYNDNPVNCSTLGGYYHWEELMQYDDTEYAQGLCPPGWHVPGESEWISLFNLYSGPAHAGDLLKSGGTSGFNALLTGGFFKNRSWVFLDFGGFFWSSSLQGSLKAWAHGMNEENHGVSFYPSSRSNAYSVRCLKD